MKYALLTLGGISLICAAYITLGAILSAIGV